MPKEEWIDVGAKDELARRELQPVTAKRLRIALCYRDETFSAISGVCNHAGGPLGEGSLDGEYVTCPWHFWKFHCRTGKGEPGFEEDRVPSYPVKVENGRVLIDIRAATPRTKKPHPPQCRPFSFLHCVPPYGCGFRACLEAQRWPSATP